LIIARHRADLAPHAFARTDEQRQNELRRIETRFADEVAQPASGAQAAQAVSGERHSKGL
jgi:hypothetical protein